ncbi:MAG: hypothetical protein U0936_21310 [Planctomycetaceae bacterium]
MMNIIAHRPHLWIVERRRLLLLSAITFCALTSGCKVIGTNRKTIDELMEALSAREETGIHVEAN